MFKEIKPIKNKTCNEDYCYCDEQLFIITDDDFKQKIRCYNDFATVGFMVMKTYEDRNLNVVKNFILYLKTEAYDITDFKYLIETNEKDNILFKKYKKEFEKYLLLL
jgi:hypothetical protein